MKARERLLPLLGFLLLMAGQKSETRSTMASDIGWRPYSPGLVRRLRFRMYDEQPRPHEG